MGLIAEIRDARCVVCACETSLIVGRIGYPNTPAGWGGLPPIGAGY